jgi:ribosomal protein L16 Arg81 hydroxylase
MYEAGATVCVTRIDAGDERLRRLGAAVKSQLSYAGHVDFRAYLSPDGRGFPTHFDARVATTLQIAGRKRWRFSEETALLFPVNNSGGLPKLHWEHFEPPDEAAFREVVLEPGDLLCLPAGTWHAAQAIGHSFALNLVFGQTSAPFLAILMDALGERLRADPSWRRPPPAVFQATPTPEKLPQEVSAFFADRLEELRRILEQIQPDDPGLAQAWRRLQAYATSEKEPS